MKQLACLFMLGTWFVLSSLGCQPVRSTDQIVNTEGPSLRKGRMSAALGALTLSDGRVIVIGGSENEDPFEPIQGKNAIEILDTKQKQWLPLNLDLPFPISGKAFELQDGRVLVFSAVYVLDPSSHKTTLPGKGESGPSSGPVSALLIDIKKKSYTPIYRPKNNKPGGKPLKGKGPALLQRAFAKSLQLKDGRILRVGGRTLYVNPAYKVSCKARKKEDTKKFCEYCLRDKCGPHADGEFACRTQTDCPSQRSPATKFHFQEIEIYAPPGHPKAKSSLGSVSYLKLAEGRRHVDLIELFDGRVLITGGQGPQGEGPEEAFRDSYLVNPNTMEIAKGPNMRTPREDHAMVLLQDGRVLVTGGTDGSGITQRSVEIFDPSTSLFYDGEPMDSSREDHQVARAGSLVFLLGGEVNDQADQIRNTAEVYNALTGAHLGSFFLFARVEQSENKEACKDQVIRGFAGIDDFAVVNLSENRILLLGGQQGCQDREGDYFSPGIGSRRTLILEVPTP